MHLGIHLRIKMRMFSWKRVQTKFIIIDVNFNFVFFDTCEFMWSWTAAALKEIAQKLGATGEIATHFNRLDACGLDMGINAKLLCNCSYENNTVCHVTNMYASSISFTRILILSDGSWMSLTHLGPTFGPLCFLELLRAVRNFLQQYRNFRKFLTS